MTAGAPEVLTASAAGSRLLKAGCTWHPDDQLQVCWHLGRTAASRMLQWWHMWLCRSYVLLPAHCTSATASGAPVQQNQFTCNLEDHLPRQKEHQEAAGKLIWSGTSTAVDAVLLLLTCLLVILGGHPDCECPQLHMCTRAYLVLHHLLHRSCVPAGHGTGCPQHHSTLVQEARLDLVTCDDALGQQRPQLAVEH